MPPHFAAAMRRHLSPYDGGESAGLSGLSPLFPAARERRSRGRRPPSQLPATLFAPEVPLLVSVDALGKRYVICRGVGVRWLVRRRVA